MKFNDFKIKTKLLVGFSVITAIVVGVGIMSYMGLKSLGNQLTEVSENSLPSVN